MQLMDRTPTAANVGDYVRLTKDASVRRGIKDMTDKCVAMLADHTQTQDILEAAERAVEALQEQGTTSQLVTPDQAAQAFYAHREAVESGRTSGYVQTGYNDLDDVLGGGFLASGMYVLAARPGMGKTTLAVNIADRLGKRGKSVLFVSLEMDTEQLEAKRLAREIGIPSNRLMMKRDLDPEEHQKIADGMDVLRSLPVYLDVRPSVTVQQIGELARQVKNLSLIVIDYLGKITPSSQKRYGNRAEAYTDVSGDIKTLARKFKVPVLTLCQLNRENMQRSDPTPVLSDLRDTGAIEQDADGVIFLHREDYYAKEKSPGSVYADLQVIVAKNRHGPTGGSRMIFDLDNSSMSISHKRSDPPKKHKYREPSYKQQAFYELPGSEKVPWEEQSPTDDASSGQSDEKLPF